MKTLSLSVLAVAATLAAVPAHAQEATYTVDPTHTFVTFEVQHFGTSTNRGRFDKKSGTISLGRAAKTGLVIITPATTSIYTGTAAFDKHLKSKDFFNVEVHPTATFVSDKVVFEGDKVSAVVGNLTLLGKTQSVTLKAEHFNCYENPMLKREVCGGDFQTTIQRGDYGMTYGLPGIPNDVTLVVQVEAVKQ